MSQLYRVSFISNGKTYELYARQVNQGTLMGFVELADFVFDARAQLIVDPAVEKLKTEFSGVSKTFVPMHNILRIDEVDKLGLAKIHEDATITPFPSNLYTPKQ
ncbi:MULTISPECIES: DUF1820 family protein [unclassified Agarivorans]|uniref:DUF1820 family protein n=1 Tax=unclassified Agarivorans TaxID=2636026 RepID=UPI0010DCA327|nr:MULTISPECIES: DUF1820 family protein [unclassified Agarivorans]MDO6685474.1 DUF1820 family protein [Agarivorans sp. 3_MG-2023]MDO6715860.1 DUF1820 family protein [Agarivorans sp. 2_MG-2023]MDO6764902.1 DUF1820 family protein [Agarivorans sp. 1_MG-2023]GDY25281.1 hypothetical protein AHAT_11710 [Agarivorans sp. Toyoura001]